MRAPSFVLLSIAFWGLSLAVALPTQEPSSAVARAVARVEALGGTVYYSADGTVDIVALDQPEVTDADLGLLTAFPNLRTLDLRGSGVTDAGLAALSGLSNLQEVSLKRTKVTAAAVERFRADHPGITRVELSAGARPHKLWMAALFFVPLALGVGLIRLTQRRSQHVSSTVRMRGIGLGALLVAGSVLMIAIAVAQALGHEVTLASWFR